MSRKKHSIERPILPDTRYGSKLVSKFINCMMRGGKKSVTEKAFYKAMDIVSEKIKETAPLDIFLQALENVKPVLEVKSRRVGGANYQVPVEVRQARRQALSFRWLITSARSRPERGTPNKLALEIVDAFNNTGIAVKKKEDTHRMAEANKAFAPYRW